MKYNDEIGKEKSFLPLKSTRNQPRQYQKLLEHKWAVLEHETHAQVVDSLW